MASYGQKVLDFLNENVSLKPLATTIFPDFHLEMTKQTALNCNLNDHYKVTETELQLTFYQVVFNEASALYFDEDKSDYGKVEINGEDLLFIIVEETLGIIETNSNRLMCELTIAQGLTEADRQNETIKEHYDFVVEGYRNLYQGT